MEGKWYTSSVDPEKVSLTIKGIMVGIIPAALFLAKWYNLPIAEGDLTQLIDAITVVITTVGTLISGVMIVYGLVRKFFVNNSRPR